MNKAKEAPEAATAPAKANKVKEAPETAAAPAKARRKGDLMYLGPTIAGAARHGTVFRNGMLPKGAQACIAELPMMERLFVEVEKAPDAVKELRKSRSALGTVYAQAEAHFNAQKSIRRE